MVEKQAIVSELGEIALLLPGRIAAALAANDRVKYLFALLQTARENADRPRLPTPNLRAERIASGFDDDAFDRVVEGTVRRRDDHYAIPSAAAITAHVVDAIIAMSEPFSGDEADGFRSRLHELMPPPVENDVIRGADIDRMTSGDREAGDSLHVLVMDVHKALNRLQATLASEDILGAQCHNLAAEHRSLVKAFMTGLNRTSPLRFGHPGLGTTATSNGPQLLLQNDIGTTDAHVLVIRVRDLTVTGTYSDIHLERLKFFEGLFAGTGASWDSPQTEEDSRFETGRYHLATITFTGKSAVDVGAFLDHFGSRLVFLIDWNKARKALRPFVRNRVARDLLGWAAAHDHGHRGFLEIGGARTLFDAIEYAAAGRLHYGERFDELLDAGQAESFLQLVLKLSSEGLLAGRPPRHIKEELKAELVHHFERVPVSLLRLASRHAAYTFDIAATLQEALSEPLSATRQTEVDLLIERCSHWEAQADQVLNEARDTIARLDGSEQLTAFFVRADDVTDALEESATMLELLVLRPVDFRHLAPIRALADMVLAGVQEFNKAILCARGYLQTDKLADLDDLLAASETIFRIEHEADREIRALRRKLVIDIEDHRHNFVLFEMAQLLERATDALALASHQLSGFVMTQRQGERNPAKPSRN